MIVQSNKEIIIASSYSHAKAVEDEIVQVAKDAGYNEESLFALRLSLEEALTNAIRHGNLEDFSKKLLVSYAVSEESVQVRISDEGPGFDPGAVPDPTREERLEVPSGRGLLLMRAYMDEVRFNDRGNEIYLVKYNQSHDQDARSLTRGELTLTLNVFASRAEIKLTGSADMAEAHAVSEVLEIQSGNGRINIIMDLSELEFISSMGLGALIKGHNQCRQAGGSLMLVAPMPAVRRVLFTTRLDRFFPIFESVREARDAIAPEANEGVQRGD